MARNLFGGTADSVAEDSTGARMADAIGTVWDASGAGAAKITDLTDINGAPITQLQADANGYVGPFYGPDGYERLWVDFGGGRVALVSVTVGERLGAHLTEYDPHGDRAYANTQIGAHNAVKAAHGVAGNLVGTTDTQTLTNKTLGATTFTGFVQLNGNVLQVRNTNATDNGVGGSALGDAINRWTIRSDGQITWGDGTSSRDTNLYRSEANTLKTDDNLIVAGKISATGGATFTTVAPLSQAASFGTTAFRIGAVSDSTDRFQIKGSGLHEWGDGTNNRDVNLYRSGAGALKTDGTFTAQVETSTAFTAASGFSLTSAAHRKTCGVCTVTIYLAVTATIDTTGTNTGNIVDTLCGTLPSGYRPAAPFSTGFGNGAISGEAVIDPDGTIMLRTSDYNMPVASGTTIRLAATYVL